MSIEFNKGYFPCSKTFSYAYPNCVQLRFENTGLDFVSYIGGVDAFINRIKNRLDGMIRYHGSLDINDTQFLAERLYLGEGIMLNLNGIDDLVYLGSHRTHRNFIDKFGM